MLTTTDRFAAFADECVRFVDEMGEGLRENVDPVEKAQRSSRIIGAITKKWTVPIIYLLCKRGSLGFSRLRQLLMGINSRTFSLGVRRAVITHRPPRSYTPSRKGGPWSPRWAGPMYPSRYPRRGRRAVVPFAR